MEALRILILLKYNPGPLGSHLLYYLLAIILSEFQEHSNCVHYGIIWNHLWLCKGRLIDLQGGCAALLAQQVQRPGRDENASCMWQVRAAAVLTGNSMVTAQSSRVATLKHKCEICSYAIQSNISEKEDAVTGLNSATVEVENFLAFNSHSPDYWGQI